MVHLEATTNPILVDKKGRRNWRILYFDYFRVIYKPCSIVSAFVYTLLNPSHHISQASAAAATVIHSKFGSVELTFTPASHCNLPPMTETVVLKLSYAGETHRATLTFHSDDPKDDQVLSYELVLAKVREAFPKLSSPWTLVYRDDEGDVITLSDALEFDEACHVLLGVNGNDDKPRRLHFYVLSNVSFREKVVAPVLLKVVELAGLAREATANLRNIELLGKGRDSIVRLAEGAMTQAGVAINHIRNSDVLERGRESLGYSAAHTRTLFFSARSGVSTRLRRASSAVAAGIERRRSPSGSSNGKGFEPTEFIKSPPAADLSSLPSPAVAVTIDLRQCGSRMRLVTPLNVERGGEDEPPVVVPVSVEGAEQQVSETAYESDTDTLCDEEDGREWDIVNNAESTRSTGKWARELDELRSILVHLDDELCCDLLSQYNGNVEAVVVELTNV